MKQANCPDVAECAGLHGGRNDFGVTIIMGVLKKMIVS